MSGTISLSLIERLAERERFRAAIETRIESLIALLDGIDGDPDLEPSLGALHQLDQRHGWDLAPADHRTLDLEYGGDATADAEAEPSLGSIGSCWSAAGACQDCWAGGAGTDGEEDIADQPHDAEPDEPSLASRTAVWDQRLGWGDATTPHPVDGEVGHD